MSKSKSKVKPVFFYEFMIFSETGLLLYFEDLLNGETIDVEKRLENDQEFKNRIKSTFGVCHSLSGVVEKMSEKLGDKQRHTYFNDYTTSHYKMNFFKSATGLYFLLLTSVCTYSFTRVLKYVFSNLYIELVCKNPLCSLDGRINSPKFSSSLRQYFDKLKSNSKSD